MSTIDKQAQTVLQQRITGNAVGITVLVNLMVVKVAIRTYALKLKRHTTKNIGLPMQPPRCAVFYGKPAPLVIAIPEIPISGFPEIPFSPKSRNSGIFQAKIPEIRDFHFLHYLL